MRISAPLNQKFDAIMRSISFQTVASDGSEVVYEGIFGFKVDAEMLNMSVPEFYKFSKSVTVEGGRKKLVGTALIITPERTRTLTVRLSEDEYEGLKKVAEMEGRGVEDLFRELAIRAVAQRRGL